MNCNKFGNYPFASLINFLKPLAKHSRNHWKVFAVDLNQGKRLPMASTKLNQSLSKWQFLPLFTILFLLSSNSFAQELQVKFQDWSVFKTKRGDKELCYMVSTPIKEIGNYRKRGESYFLVTNILNDADEVSISSGFFYKNKSDIELSFGSKKFYLFPYLMLAWAHDKNDDIDIIKQMQKSEEIIVTAVSKDGKAASDTYSLIGFVQAYAKMKDICQGYSQSYFVGYSKNDLNGVKE